MVKTIITRKTDDVITNIATISELQGENLLVDNSYFIARINEDYNVYPDVETSDSIAPEQYIYTVSNGFIKNINYKPYVSNEAAIAELQAQNAQMLLALVNGGLL